MTATALSRWRPLLLLVAATVVMAACALPTDDGAQIVTDPDLAEVANPSTTTSTTTGGAEQRRTLHFIGENDRLVSMERSLDSELAIHEILNELAVPLPEDSTAELRNTVPPDLVISTAVVDDDGTLRIHLADDELLQVPGSDLTRAVAQIVVTAMGLDGSIDAVRFFVDEEPQSVPAGGEGVTKSEPVDQCDYAQFLSDQDRVRFGCPSVSTS